MLTDLKSGLARQPKFGLHPSLFSLIQFLYFCCLRRLIKYSLNCYKNLAVNAASVEEMIESGVIETLQLLLKNNPGNDSVIQQINEIIAHMCMNDRLASLIAAKMEGDFRPLFVSLSSKNELTKASTTAAFTALCRQPAVSIALVEQVSHSFLRFLTFSQSIRVLSRWYVPILSRPLPRFYLHQAARCYRCVPELVQEF